jgi:ABC-2 type transport system ATP-binding protein
MAAWQFAAPAPRQEMAARHGIALHELVARQASLEEAFMALTGDAVDYQPHPASAGKAA